MELTAGIPLRKTNHSRIHDVDFNNLEFGKYISDHMLVCVTEIKTKTDIDLFVTLLEDACR